MLMVDTKTPDVTEEDAFHFIVRMLRENTPTMYSKYGYDLYIPEACRTYLEHVTEFKSQGGNVEVHHRLISPQFMAAAWEMARRGILRPGVKSTDSQSTDKGNAGCGFSLTSAGKEWVEASGHFEFVPTDPGRFSKQLDAFTSRFGDSFQERSQDAIRCYNALAYLACCAMCGAAAESILLAVAIAKSGDEESVNKEYLASGGRSRIEKRILGQQKKAIADEFRGYLSLLKYWRDSAAHGHRTGIDDGEAYTSLALLLRFAHFVSDRWGELTKS